METSIYDVAAVIGAAAWLYPIGVILYKILARPKLRVTSANTLAVGYSSLGPLLNWQCTIATERTDALIEKIQARLTHREGDVHLFTWGYLDETQGQWQADVGGGSATLRKFQQAIALKVWQTGLTEKNINYDDPDFISTLNTHRQRLISLKNDQIKAGDSDVRKTISVSREYVQAGDHFKNSFYWKSGEYKVELLISEVKLKRPHSEKFAFTLTDSDIEALRKNIDTVILNLFSVYSLNLNDEQVEHVEPQWNWAYPRVRRVD